VTEPLAEAAGSAGCAPTVLIEERVALPGGEIELTRPRDPEALLSEDAFEHEEFLPYWAELWTSGVALAHDVARRSLRGARTVELGCGLALPSIAAARAGGRVLATDWSPDAVAAATANARRNDAEIETLVCDWAEPAAILERAPFQLVLASDVLYEQRNVDQLLELLPRLVNEHGRILLADPGRAPAERFLEGARHHFEVTTTMSARFPRVAIHRLRGRSASAT
jgi:predicted nicotinamide N-methyase